MSEAAGGEAGMGTALGATLLTESRKMDSTWRRKRDLAFEIFEFRAGSNTNVGKAGGERKRGRGGEGGREAGERE